MGGSISEFALEGLKKQIVELMWLIQDWGHPFENMFLEGHLCVVAILAKQIKIC